MRLEESPYARTDLICGTWYVNFSASPKGNLLLQKEPVHPIPADISGSRPIKGWGHRYEFYNDGRLIDADSEPCGNDESIHRWPGKWSWNEDQSVLLIQTSHYKTVEELYVLELNSQTMLIRDSELAYECKSGHRFLISEYRIREARARSMDRKFYVYDWTQGKHRVFFDQGKMIKVICSDSQ